MLAAVAHFKKFEVFRKIFVLVTDELISRPFNQ